MKRLACVVLALAAFGWLLFATLWYFHLPFYGFEVLNFPENRALPLAEGALVQEGDRVKEVNDRPLENPGDLAAILRAAAGSPVKLEVERDGQRLELVQHSLPHSPRVMLRHAANNLAALVLLAVGLLVVLRPTGTSGRVLFLFCVAVALLMAGLPQALGSELFQRVAGHAILAALLFSGAFLFHFFLLFPRSHRFLSRFPRLGRFLYLPPAIFLLVIIAINLIPRAVAEPLVKAGAPYAWLVKLLIMSLVLGAFLALIGYLIAAVVVFVDSYRRLDEPLEREKLRWVVWGVAVSILPSAALLLVEEIARVSVPYSDVWWPLLMLLLPASFAYAILSHRIMDIDIVLNRGLVYGAVTAVLLVVFIALENLLAALSLEVTGASSFTFAMTAAVALAVLLNPVKTRVQLFVDRLFFAYKVKLREGLKDLAEELSYITHLDRMEQLLLRRLVDLAEARAAVLFLREEQGDGYELVEAMSAKAASGGRLSLPEAGTRFEADDALVIWLLRQSRPLALEGLSDGEMDGRLEERDGRLLRGMEAALVLPLRLRGDLVGLILLSRRRNKELFNRDEIGLLHNLAIQAAADVANARLRAISTRLERENGDLRQELLAALRDRSSIAGRA